MTIAIFNASGAQASAISRQVEEAGLPVRRLSRSAGVGRVAVDPEDEDSIARGLDGTEGAVFTVPQDYRAGVREAYAERVVRAAERAGLGRLVVNMGGPVYAQLDHPMTRELEQVRSILTGGGVPSVVLQPTSFLDNLVEPWAVGAIVGGGVLAYPAPPQVRVSWISHRSLGDLAVAALRRPTTVGRIFDVGGPAPISGEELAEAVGRAAGRPVRYVEMPLEDFAGALDHVFGAPAGKRVAALYRHYRDEPQAGERDPAGWAELEVAPESVDAWAARQSWRVPAQA
jgi:uncharacterized protein YbjT (DUF2867 family)